MFIELLNKALNFVGDASWSLLGNNSYLYLYLLAAVAGVVLVYIYGKVSNQKKIKQTKRSIYGFLLEAILFRHSAWLTLAAQIKMFGLGGKYLMLAVPPLLILMLPCLLLLAQINRFVGVQPLNSEYKSLVSVSAENNQLFNINLVPNSDGITVSKPVRTTSDHLVTWRVDVQRANSNGLTLQIGDNSATVIPLKLNGFEPSVTLVTNTWWKSLLYPATINLPVGVKEVAISYVDANYSLLGWQLHWVIIFFIVSLVAGLAASKLFKIEI